MPGGQSRWSAGKDLSWEPLRIERVCEVKYDHMQGDRFRHAAIFQRWRPDKRPIDCGYDQLEVTTPYELEKVFGAAGPAHPLTPAPVVEIIVGIERFLLRPERLGDVLQVDANPRPGLKTAAHRVHEHVSGFEMCARIRMARLPAFETCERVRFLARAADFDQRVLGFGLALVGPPSPGECRPACAGVTA